MASGPQVGEEAPDFQLDSTHGAVRLRDRIARGPVLLVFYPGDDTPVCTRQLCDYRDHLEGFSDLGVDVVAINAQSLASHRAFAAKHELPFPLVSDPDGATCRAYGAKGLLGTVKRALFLVGRDGRVRYRQVDLPIFRRRADELREAFERLDL